MRHRLTTALAAAWIAAWSCSGPGGDRTPGESGPGAGLETPPVEDWITHYDPERAWSGYTLALHFARVPVLVDMNGRVVHAWPEARVKDRIRLLPDGHLLGIGTDNSVREYAWDGELVWEHRPEGMFPHHDLIRLANGNTMLLTQVPGSGTDDLVEVDRRGRAVWRWRAAEHLAEYLGRRDRDLTHVNSVQELPDNPWHRAGDERFRPGNLLISARNLNALFVLERASGRPVWRYDRDLDLQHEALMIPPGHFGAGGILLFDNGYANRLRWRSSRVIEIDPRRNAVRWSYSEDGFYSPTHGAEQPLPNGNVLVISSRGSRAFEVTRGGQIVWQWTPPYETRRMLRVAYDHCPQLAALPSPEERPVAPPAGWRHVDPPAYQFVRGHRLEERRIDGVKRKLLPAPRTCMRLFLPRATRVHAGYGLDGGRLRAAGRSAYSARFRLTLEPAGADERRVLFEDEVALGGPTWRQRQPEIRGLPYAWARLCAETEPSAPDPGPRFARWANLYLEALDGVRVAAPAEPEPDADELAARRQHLEALGYVD